MVEIGKLRRKMDQLKTESFRLITITLLSLLVPLAFLLLSRLSAVAVLLSPPSFFFSVLFSTNPALLYVVVSLISVYTLINILTTKINNNHSTDLNRSIVLFYPRVEISCFFLLLLQFLVGLGLHGTISEGINGVIIGGKERSFWIKLVFFFGLYDVMLLWCRLIVKPVVHIALTGEEFDLDRVRDRRSETVILAVSCGALWWWKLRDEIESLVRYDFNSVIDLGTVDFLNLWLYYTIVTIGVIRIVKGFFWFVMILFFEQVRRNSSGVSESSVNKV